MNELRPILDPCCGSRKFYFDKESQLVLFGDIRQETITQYDGRVLSIAPDMKVDFRALPFMDESFSLVIFDPPHLVDAGKSSILGQSYGVLDRQTWKRDLKMGFEECWRVLKENGTLIFKWSEKDIPLATVLRLFSQRPLLGNRRPSTNGFWLLFFKAASLGEQ